MKKLSGILFFLTLAFTVSAQSKWEKPSDKSSAASEVKASAKNAIDPKYMQGAVPEVDGKVTWEHTYSLPGQSASEIYGKALTFFQNFVKGDKQTENSNVGVVNETDHQIGVRAQEWLVLHKNALMLDQVRMTYSMLVTCGNGVCKVTMSRIHYNYEEDRPSASEFTAEEMISDKVAINKKGTDFKKSGAKKFRIKTIDRKDDIFSQLGEALK